jgi:preprotein translocase subunit YajC
MSFSLNPVFAQATTPAAAPAPTGAPAASTPPPAPAAPQPQPTPPANNELPAADATAAPGPLTTATQIVPPPGGTPAGDKPPESNPLMTFLPLILIFVAMYFLLIRPQQKREKEIRKRQSELKNGDQVVTSSGIFGKVVGIDNDRVTLQVGEGTRIVFQRQAVVGFTGDDSNKK